MPNRDVALSTPKRFQWEIAADTTPVNGRWPLLRSIERKCAAIFERYSVVESDVVLVGDDPLVLIIAARQVAVSGRSVLLVYVPSINTSLARQKAACTRPALFPDQARDMVRTVFPHLRVPEDAGLLMALGEITDEIAGFINADGSPAVRLYSGSGFLVPHPGCMAPQDRQVLVPAPAWPCAIGSRPKAYAALARELRRLPKVQFGRRRQLEMQIAVVGEVVMVSQCPALANASWTVPVTRIAGAARGIEGYDSFGPADRYLDLYDAVIVSDLIARARSGRRDST